MQLEAMDLDKQNTFSIFLFQDAVRLLIPY